MRSIDGPGKHWNYIFAAGIAACLLCGGSVSAQTSQAPVYDACEPGLRQIDATELPSVVDLDRCPVGERPIVSDGVGSELPDSGDAVHVEALTATGARELDLVHRSDGAMEIETEDAEASGGISTLARSPKECRDGAFNDLDYRESNGLAYTFARSTTPPELRADAAEGAITNGGSNITSTRNRCGRADVVPVELTYLGGSENHADVNDGGSCSGNEGTSEVSFGDLPNGTLAVACTVRSVQPGYDEVFESDVKVNRNDFTWTTRPGARSCRNRYDLESVMTHEQGHTFGLGHVGENAHGSLTMSPQIRPCRDAERTLGLGDVRGLDVKYP